MYVCVCEKINDLITNWVKQHPKFILNIRLNYFYRKPKRKLNVKTLNYMQTQIRFI